MIPWRTVSGFRAWLDYQRRQGERLDLTIMVILIAVAAAVAVMSRHIR